VKYLEIWENLREQSRILLILVGFLLVMNLALIFIVISLSLKREIVVYLPPYEKVYVGGREYVLLWARYFTNLITSFNPENVEERVKLLAQYAYSDDIKLTLIEEGKHIKKDRIEQVFHPFEGTWKLDPRTREISVKGRLRKSVGGEEIENRTATFRLYMRIIHGKPYLVGFRYE